MSSVVGRRLPPTQVDCMWWKQGYCARGKTCHFRHDEAMAGVDNKPGVAAPDGAARVSRKEEAEARISVSAESTVNTAGPSTSDPADASSPTSTQICTICLEIPDTFGLLLNCDHVFCLECIRNWRSSTTAALPSNDELKSTSKTCPMCRSHSDYIIPSSLFPSPPSATISSTLEPPENTQKSEIVHRYLSRLSSIPCRYFTSSLSESSPLIRPKCRFGNTCHYAHIHPITKEPYVFSAEELQPPRRRQRCNRDRVRYVEEMALMEQIFADLGMEGGTEDEWGCDDEDEVEGMGGFEGSEMAAFFEEGDVGEFLTSGLEGLDLGFDLDWDELEFNYG